jgi:hypothetical protein
MKMAKQSDIIFNFWFTINTSKFNAYVYLKKEKAPIKKIEATFY